MKSNAKGFTLVEIAIVLVIIGLLLGGILKGQEMITQAKIKNVMSDFSGISAAFHGYQDRYRAIPGDDPNAATRWSLGTVTLASGAYGDGQIAGGYASTTTNEESRVFWWHLRQSGFVAGANQNQPFNALTGLIGVQTGNSAGGAALGGFSGLIICSANLSDKIAAAVDTQMDDGLPATGTVRAILQSAPNPPINAGATPPATYVENGTNTYTICRAL